MACNCSRILWIISRFRVCLTIRDNKRVKEKVAYTQLICWEIKPKISRNAENWNYLTTRHNLLSFEWEQMRSSASFLQWQTGSGLNIKNVIAIKQSKAWNSARELLLLCCILEHKSSYQHRLALKSAISLCLLWKIMICWSWFVIQAV